MDCIFFIPAAHSERADQVVAYTDSMVLFVHFEH